MPLSRRSFNRFLLASCAAFLSPGTTFGSSASRELKEGRDWRAVSPPRSNEDPQAIEVLEFFSYGCSHCARINPLVKDWVATLPDDVSFRRVPVTFGRAAWENLARLYYALEISGELERLDQPVFDAVTQERVSLYREDKILEWVAAEGVDPEAFAQVFNGFAVATQVVRAKTLTEHYQVDGVPMIAVAGRYAVLSEGAKSYQDLLSIAEGLIARARQEQAS